MTRSLRWFSLLIVLALAGCSGHTGSATKVTTAASTPTSRAASEMSAPGPRYLKPDSINVSQLLPNPPADGSAENLLEYETLKRAVATASPADKARTRREIDMNVFVFDDVMGPWFNAQNCPHAAALFKQAATDARYFSAQGKNFWDRRRPSPRDGFTPLYPDPDPKVRSYPSGHSTRGTVWAELLAEMYPSQREALLARGRQIGYDRMIAGVHYPTDIYAGRTVGHAAARLLLHNVAFRAQLDQVKAEMDEAKAKTSSAGAATPQNASR